MPEVEFPLSFQGWEVIDTGDPSKRGIVLSDEYSTNLVSSVITVDWNNEPPQVVLVDREHLIEIDSGYLMIRTAGRYLGFCMVPLIHQCKSVCNLHTKDKKARA